MNSLSVLLGFLAFALLGYLSLVRLLYKLDNEMRDKSNQVLFPDQLKQVVSTSSTNGLLAGSALFLSLPTLPLLLFWGWGPALLWIVVAHLLIETPANFISSRMHQQVDLEQHFSDFSSWNTSLRAIVLRLILLGVAALILTLVVTMIDQLTGLVFALAAVILACSQMKWSNSRLELSWRAVVILATLALGLTLANKLGINVYGKLEFEQISWLRVDNQTLLSLLVTVAAFQLSQSAALISKVNNITSFLVLAITATLFILLAWSQPVLDAPTLSSSLPNTDASSHILPNFVSLFLLLSPTLIILLIVLSQPNSLVKEGSETAALNLTTRLGSSLLLFLFSIALVVAVSTANGIGAWNTHFFDFSFALNLQTYFKLTLDVLNHACAVEFMQGNLANTLLLTTIALAGLVSLTQIITMLAKLRVAAKASASEPKQFVPPDLSWNLPQILLILLATAWLLEHGISLHVWMGLISLSWAVTCEVLLDYAREPSSATRHDQVQRGFALALFFIGGGQILWTGLNALLAGNLVLALMLGASLMLGLLLGTEHALNCIKGLQIKNEEKLF